MRNVEYFAEQPVDTVISLDNDDTEKAVDIILNDDLSHGNSMEKVVLRSDILSG